jgi:hypothetical protein
MSNSIGKDLESAAFGDLTFISGDVLLPFSGLNNYLNK